MIIIPCAGYGTRMNMDPNKSKEMLTDPVNKRPLIDWSFNNISKYTPDEKILLITREQKKDLISYISGYDIEVHILEEDTHDWTSTILATKHLWEEKNIIMLPDTRFSKEDILPHMFYKLDHKNMVFALHNVSDGENWGIIVNDQICEKPQGFKYGKAWGLLGFRKDSGEQLLNNMSQKNKWSNLKDPDYVELNRFWDITRTGYLTTYE